MKTETKEIYQAILDINLKIHERLNNFPKENFDNFNEILAVLIDQKGQLIQKLTFFKENYEEELKKILCDEEIQEISAQIDKYEEENLLLIQEKKAGLSKEIRDTNRTKKAFSAYKFDKQDKPRLIDETE